MPSEISDAELDAMEGLVADAELSNNESQWMNGYEPQSVVAPIEVLNLIAALRATRERLAAAEAVCELFWADRSLMTNNRGMTSPHGRALDAWSALAHPKPEEAAGEETSDAE